MSKIARIYQGINEIQKYYQGGVLQRLFFDWKHYIGNELNIEYAKECAGRNVVIEGKTYQNLLNGTRKISPLYSETDDSYSLDIETGQPMIIHYSTLIKPLTTYTLIINITDYTVGVIHTSIMNNTNDTTIKVASNERQIYGRGVHKVTLTTKNNIVDSYIRIFPRANVQNTYSISKNILLLEGDYTNIDLPTSIDGIESVGKREFVKSKNLFNLHDWYDNNVWFNVTDNQIRYLKNSNAANGVYVSKINKLLKGTYRISLEGEGEGAVYSRIEVYSVVEGVSTKIKDTNVNSNLYNSLSFILNEDMDIKFKFFVVDSDNTVRNGYMIKNIQLEQNSVSTEYEPFYEYYPVTIRNYNYKCDTDNIVLPNGTKNSIETIDGKKVHVQRVEKIIVTKQKDATKFGAISNTYGHRLYYINSNIYGKKGKCDNAEIGVISNKFIGIADDEWRSSEKVNCCFMNINGVVHFLVDKTEFPSQETFNDWLEKNEVTVYYPLAEPIYTYLESGLYDDITIPTSGIKNEIYLENGKWYHKKNIGKVVFDGSSDENWNYYNKGSIQRFNILMSNDAKMYSTRKPVYAVGYQFNASKNDDKIIFISGVETVNKLYIYNYAYTSVEDFRVYLAENPLEVYYELAEPIISELYFSDITYKLNEPLRSLPNGVCDTVEGNKLIQRVGKVVLDGSNDENWSLRANAESSNFIYFHSSFSTMNKSFTNYTQSKNRMICDKLLVSSNAGDNIAKEQCICGRGSGYGFCIALLKSNLETVDLTGFLKWLSENPVTVYYELATPIETEITPDMILINGEPITDTVGIELPDGTKDSIENGCYVKRVEKVIFDENIKTYQTLMIVNNNVIIRTRKFSMAIGDGNIISNVTVISWMHDKNNLEEVTETKIMAISSASGWNEANIIIPSSYFEGDITMEAVKEFLAENPVTMYYELMNPIKIPLFLIKEGLTTLKSTNNITPQIELDCLVRDKFQNMCPNTWVNGDIALASGVEYSSSTSRIKLQDYIAVQPNTTYYCDTFSEIVYSTTGKIGVRYYKNNKTYISGGGIGVAKTSYNKFTTPEDCYYIKFIVETLDTNYKMYLRPVK